MKDKEFMVEKIRSQYTEREHTELDALKALDAKVKKPVNVFGYTYGSIGAIVMGAGMSLVMTDIGAILGLTETLIPGIAIGAVGLVVGIGMFNLGAEEICPSDPGAERTRHERVRCER